MDANAELRRAIEELEEGTELRASQLANIQKLAYKAGNPQLSDFILALLPKIQDAKEI